MAELYLPQIKRGSSAIEYAVLAAVVAAAIMSMAVYTKRAISGKWRDSADSIGHGRLYEKCVTVVTECDPSGCRTVDDC